MTANKRPRFDEWDPGMIPSAEQREFLLRAELCACKIRQWLNEHAKTFWKLRRRDVFRGVNGQRYPYGVFDEALLHLETNGFITVEGTRIRVVDDKLVRRTSRVRACNAEAQVNATLIKED